MGNPSLLFPSLWFVCIVSYPFTVSPSACLFFLWPFTKYLKTGIKLFLYYLFFRLNKPVSPRHKDSTPDAASQVSNTVKKKISCHQAAVLLYGVIFQHQGPNVTCIQFSAHQNSQDILMDLLFFFFQVVPQSVLLYQVNFIPVSELHTHFCWTSQSFCQPIPETCQDASEDLPCSPMY